MTYRLTPGPLADARRARHARRPGKRHIMIIDEINRANLPKVLGELLFLLEYRDEAVRTLYRPDDAFELPKNLWFIGTMNTADRSIALVDAALRRRFHFMPFFPNHGPMEGLLDRWLDRARRAGVGRRAGRHGQRRAARRARRPAPPARSQPLHEATASTRTRSRRIWEYNIEPFIEDQFFGDPDKIAHFRFANVLQRYTQSIESRDRGHRRDRRCCRGRRAARRRAATTSRPGRMTASDVRSSPSTRRSTALPVLAAGGTARTRQASSTVAPAGAGRWRVTARTTSDRSSSTTSSC